MPITLTLAAAAALINFWLAMRIQVLRVRNKALNGDEGNPVLAKRMRAQANFVEYTPFVLILAGLIEYAGGSATILWVAGLAYLVARLLHPFGVETAGVNPLRAIGAMATWAVLVGLAGWALAIVYGMKH